MQAQEANPGFAVELRFPFELINYAVDYLWDEVPSLKACTLTSKTWHAATRPHIFRLIKLHGSEKLAAFQSIVDKEPLVGRWVRELHLRKSSWSYKEPVDWVIGLPDALGGKLPLLRTLHLFDYFMFSDKWTLQWFSHLGGAFPSVHTLRLKGTNMWANHFERLVCALPCLSNIGLFDSDVTSTEGFLMMDEDDPEHDGGPFSGTPHDDLRLTCLHISQEERYSTLYSAILPWIASSGSAHTLRTVIAKVSEDHTGSPYPNDVGAFLSACGGSLEELRLSFSHARNWHFAEAPIRLSHLTGLRLLDLGDPTHPAVMSILSHPSRPFSTYFSPQPSPESSTSRNKSCKPLDDHLNEPMFASLQAVVVSYRGPLDEDVVTRKMQRVFGKPFVGVY